MKKPSDDVLRSVLRAIRRRWIVFAVCALGVPLAAATFSLLQEKQYTAAASLLFRDPAFDQKLFGSSYLAPSADPAREAATNVKLVALDEVAARSAKRIGLSPTVVSARVEVAAEGLSDVVSVKATDPRPARAARLANVFASEYIGFRREADRSKVATAQSLIENQLQSLTRAEREGPRGRSLRGRAEELGVFAALQTGNAELVQRARIPDGPSSPDIARNVVLGAVLGLLLGLALASLFDRWDRRLTDVDEITRILHRPVLGLVPRTRILAGGPQPQGPRAPEAEAFRILRANLRYFNVDRVIISVLVTSASQGEGKSTVSANLARAAAQTGARVLVLESDLRQPSLAKQFGLEVGDGLSNVLAGSRTLSQVTRTLDGEGLGENVPSRAALDVVLAGPLPPNPSELLASDRMIAVLRDAEERYDLVVVDTPPTQVVADVIPLVNEVSGVVVVTRLGHSSRDAVGRFNDQLTNLGAHTLGVVVNGVDVPTADYGYGYSYSDPSAVDRSQEAVVTEPA